MEVQGSRRNVSRFAGIAVVAGAAVAIGVAVLLPSSSTSAPQVKLVTPAAVIDETTTTVPLGASSVDPVVHQAPAVHASAPVAASADVSTPPTTVAPAQTSTTTAAPVEINSARRGMCMSTFDGVLVLPADSPDHVKAHTWLNAQGITDDEIAALIAQGEPYNTGAACSAVGW